MSRGRCRRCSRGFGRHDLDAPRGEAIGLIDGDVEAGRVAQRDLVEDEVVDVAQDDHGGNALLLVFDFGLVREIPPGDVLTEIGAPNGRSLPLG